MRLQNKHLGRLVDWLAIGWLGAITYLSLGWLPELPELPAGDKYEHAAAYALLVVLALPQRRSYVAIFAVVVAIVLYGGLIELIQPFVNRRGEFNDFLANCAGVIIGGGLIFSFSRLNAWFRER